MHTCLYSGDVVSTDLAWASAVRLIKFRLSLLIIEFEMAYLLPHLYSGWEVDQAILGEDKKLVVPCVE